MQFCNHVQLKNIPAHNIFLIFALFFGLIYSIITPPFQVPDEINHFYRAYQISGGNFHAVKKNDRVGGYIPESLVLFSNLFRKFQLNSFCKLNSEYIKKISLQPDKTIFKDFPNSALYSPVSYIPQSTAICVFRLFKWTPFHLLYAARIATLIFWVLLVYFSIRIMPVQKWLIVFLALLPMSLSINSSLSADVVTNGLSFFLIAYISKIAFTDKNFTKKDLIIISIFIVLLGFAKLLYVLLIFLFLIIPVSKFKSFKEYFIVFGLLIILGLGSAVIGKKSIDKLYTPYEKYNMQYRDDVIIS